MLALVFFINCFYCCLCTNRTTINHLHEPPAIMLEVHKRTAPSCHWYTTGTLKTNNYPYTYSINSLPTICSNIPDRKHQRQFWGKRPGNQPHLQTKKVKNIKDKKHPTAPRVDGPRYTWQEIVGPALVIVFMGIRVKKEIAGFSSQRQRGFQEGARRGVMY